MKKGILLLVVLMLPFISAANLTVDYTDRGDVIISELNNPAIFDFNVKNADSDSFEIYTLIGVSMSPKGKFDVPSGESEFEVRAYPNEDVRKNNGLYIFEYQMKGDKYGIFKDKLMIRILPLEEVVSLTVSDIELGEDKAEIIVKNNNNAVIENEEVMFKSPFFDSVQKISLKPFEELKISVDINKDATKKLIFGSYVITGEFKNGVILDGTFDYVEKEQISTMKNVSGFLIRKSVITKVNEGNSVAISRIELNKDIISRLFTTYSLEPIEAKRGVFSVDYAWEKELKPAESFDVAIKTNYTLPVVLIALIVAIAVFVSMYNRTSLVLKKRVSFVKTHGGEFAVKVTLHVSAKKHVDDIQVIDSLPGVTKLYEGYGNRPDKIDAGTRRLFWNIHSLNAGEERIISYIVYTKLKIVGRFELPSAAAIFNASGKNEEVFSNRAYFVNEIVSKEY